MNAWHSMETAPKDTAVLVHEQKRGVLGDDVRYTFVARSRDGASWWSIPGVYQCHPTHWQPLPDPPVVSPAQEPTP